MFDFLDLLSTHVQRLFFSSETKKKHVATAAVAEMRTESDKGLPIATWKKATPLQGDLARFVFNDGILSWLM